MEIEIVAVPVEGLNKFTNQILVTLIAMRDYDQYENSDNEPSIYEVVAKELGIDVKWLLEIARINEIQD